MRLFLGLDSSTQSLTATVLDLDSAEVVEQRTLNFEEDLPQYGTDHGVLRNGDARVAHAPPLMWAEALDQVLSAMKADGVALDQVLAVAGSGQQHGSVYVRASLSEALAGLDPDRALAPQLEGHFARATSPIWMDSSTFEECAEITAALGGASTVAEVTGSCAFERFTGPQIRKFFKQDAEGYAATAEIQLVSSFMASLLAGALVPIDHGDGAGMNLMDIQSRRWHDGALHATAPDLAPRLSDPVPSWTIAGKVSSYAVQRWGLSPEALNVVWSGDNPNSLIGLGLVKPGDVAISLGTSDTFFGVMSACRVDPRGEGHVFVSPTGDPMSLICFKNGSLAREKVRDHFGLDWDGFSAALERTPKGNDGKLMLPWFEPEIVPRVLEPNVQMQGLDAADADGHCRAVVESQMMSMRVHSAWMEVRPTRIYATGGASNNPAILRIMADVHQCPVQRLEVGNSAALGAAIRAAHAWLKAGGEDGDGDWESMTGAILAGCRSGLLEPDPSVAELYREQTARYASFEESYL